MHGRIAQRERALRLGLPIEIDRQACERARAQAPVAVAEGTQRFLQQVDARLIDDPAPRPQKPRALAGEAERAAGEERRVGERTGDVGGAAKRLACTASVGRLPLRVAPGEEQLAALALVGGARALERVERIGEVRRRRLVSERRCRLPTCARCVRNRFVATARGRRLAKVMR